MEEESACIEIGVEACTWPGSGIWDLGSGIWDLGPGARGLGPGTRPTNLGRLLGQVEPYPLKPARTPWPRI